MHRAYSAIGSLILTDVAVQIYDLNNDLNEVADALLFRETLTGESSVGVALKFIIWPF